VELGSEATGLVPVRISADQAISLKLSDLLSLVRADMEPEIYARLSGSESADEYVSFSRLRAAGMDLRYDAGSDRIVLASGSGG